MGGEQTHVGLMALNRDLKQRRTEDNYDGSNLLHPLWAFKYVWASKPKKVVDRCLVFLVKKAQICQICVENLIKVLVCKKKSVFVSFLQMRPESAKLD